MLKDILIALAVVGISGLVFGYLLSLASKYFAVEKDKTVMKVRECLPGANCGGCGYSGCDAYAEAIVKEKAPVNLCNAGGQKAADAIAAICGRNAGSVVPKKAFVRCSGGGSGKVRYEFSGITSCIPASRVDGGPHVCSFACVGFGSCTKVCKFNAISVKNGVAIVDFNKCTGCGACVAECPKKIIELVPADHYVRVPCHSHLKAADTMKSCDLGCIGCKRCEKSCEHGAITINEALAHIDYEKCVSCGACVDVCPRKLIINLALDKPPVVLPDEKENKKTTKPVKNAHSAKQVKKNIVENGKNLSIEDKILQNHDNPVVSAPTPVVVATPIETPKETVKVEAETKAVEIAAEPPVVTVAPAVTEIPVEPIIPAVPEVPATTAMPDIPAIDPPVATEPAAPEAPKTPIFFDEVPETKEMVSEAVPEKDEVPIVPHRDEPVSPEIVGEIMKNITGENKE